MNIGNDGTEMAADGAPSFEEARYEDMLRQRARQEKNALAAERVRRDKAERDEMLKSRLKAALKKKKTVSKPPVTRSATRQGRMWGSKMNVDDENETASNDADGNVISFEEARRADMVREARRRLRKRANPPSSTSSIAKRRRSERARSAHARQNPEPRSASGMAENTRVVTPGRRQPWSARTRPPKSAWGGSEPARSVPVQQNPKPRNVSGMAENTRVVTPGRRQPRSAIRRPRQTAWSWNLPPPTAGNGEQNSASAHVNAAIVEVVNGGDPLTVNAHLNAAAERLEDEPDQNVAAAVDAVRVAANTPSPEAAAINIIRAQSRLNNANNHNREALPRTNVKTSASANEEARVANTKSAGPSWFNPLAHVAGFLSGLRQGGGAMGRHVERERNRNTSPVRTATPNETPNERGRNRSPIRTKTPREPVVRNKGKRKVNNDEGQRNNRTHKTSKPVTAFGNSVPKTNSSACFLRVFSGKCTFKSKCRGTELQELPARARRVMREG
jgi:hypothetical protein